MVALGALFSVLISSVFALTTPYVLARTGSEVTLGILMAIMSVGGVLGAILIGVWGGFKRRVNTILFGMILTVIGTVLFGVNVSPLALGAALFIAMMSVAINNTVLMTLLQAKVPGDMQGRIFAIVMQLALLLMPVGYLVIGPLADQVFTPLASTPEWAAGTLGMLFGSGAAGGMGLLFAASGVLALVALLVTFALRSVRNMEDTLPSYQTAADAVPMP
jgi:MFS family permease